MGLWQMVWAGYCVLMLERLSSCGFTEGPIG